MSADATTTIAAPETAPRGHLFRAEFRRLRHRRFIRWLLILGALGYFALIAIAFTQYDKPTAQSQAQAEARRDEQIAQELVWYEECLTQPLPDNEPPENYCGPPPDASSYPLSYFMDQPAFVMQNDLPSAATGIAVMVGGFCFLIGATWIGAEWSQKTLMALLFWEPRRIKVLATKVTVLVGAVVAIAVAAQALWLAAGVLLATSRGVTTVTSDFWPDLLAQQGRGVLLAVLLALIGFGLAHLIRNTGAALGVGFVYFIAELIVISVKPAWQEWSLSFNVAALLNKGGLSYYVAPAASYANESSGSSSSGSASISDEGYDVLVSNLHGGLLLAGVALALLLLGGWLFKRRDLT